MTKNPPILRVRDQFERPIRANTPTPSTSEENHLSNEGGGGSGLVTPGGGQDTDGLVVTRQTVDTGLDENETELGVLVLAVALKVLADGNSLLDEVVQILGELGGEA